MLNFEKAFLQTKRIDNYRLIILHGENIHQKELIVNQLRDYFNVNFMILQNIKDFENALMVRNLFGDRNFFLFENVNEKHMQNYLRLFEAQSMMTENVFVLIHESTMQTRIIHQFILIVNCENLTQNDKLNFVRQKIIEYQMHLNEEQINLIANKFTDENILSMNNELEKLYIAFLNSSQISNENIETLLDLKSKTRINTFMRMIVYRNEEVFTILKQFVQDYSPIFVIRIIYNYFINLSKTFLYMRIHNCNFDIACRKHYGVILDDNLIEFKKHIRQYNFKRLRYVLFSIVECEIEIKKNFQMSAFIKLFNKMFYMELPHAS